MKTVNHAVFNYKISICILYFITLKNTRHFQILIHQHKQHLKKYPVNIFICVCAERYQTVLQQHIICINIIFIPFQNQNLKKNGMLYLTKRSY